MTGAEIADELKDGWTDSPRGTPRQRRSLSAAGRIPLDLRAALGVHAVEYPNRNDMYVGGARQVARQQTTSGYPYPSHPGFSPKDICVRSSDTQSIFFWVSDLAGMIRGCSSLRASTCTDQHVWMGGCRNCLTGAPES